MMNKVPYPELDTPAVLLDLDRLAANIKEMSDCAADAGVKLRPHVKVHESALISKMQIEAGACGIEVGPIDQALAMAEAGLNDIIIAHPFYGEHKLEKLKKLLSMPGVKVSVVVDMLEQAEGISQVGRKLGQKVPVIIKVESGANRYGTPPGEETVALAKKLSRLPGVRFTGIYAHEVYGEPTPDKQDAAAIEVLELISATAKLLKEAGFKLEHVSVGSSATWRAVCRQIKSGAFPEVNEIHPGSGIVGAMLQVKRFALTEDQCALTIIASVMSTSHPGHAVIDVGQKTMGADSLISFRDRPGFFWQNMPSYGAIRGRPDLYLGALHAEVSRVFYRDPAKKLKLGERLEIIPNNPFIIINTQEKLYGVRRGRVETIIPVTGRGKGT
jgi:D-serine deaminase-like pyridoxal phosphate-dependent protein